MKKLIFSLSFLLVFSAQVWSKQRSLDEMKAAAASVIANHAKTRGAASLKVLKQDNQLTMLGYAGGGYAVIANDDRFPAVLGYSENPSSGDNPGFQWWMNAMSEALAANAESGQSVTPISIPEGYKTSVPELMTTRWGQGTPYNNLCPTYPNQLTGGENHFLTGCVATSISQILYYHRYPINGEGSKIYNFVNPETGRSQRLQANFEATTYDWDNMLPTYTEGNYGLVQATAVATIMYHVGVSVEMNYTVGASGALHNVACLSLRNYFRCNDGIKMYMRDYFPQQEWMDIIYRELNDGCPVLYGGQAEEFGGHSFVIDGYDANGLVHVNWGWEGSDNGFYDISLLNPPSANHNSFLSQNMVIVRPDNDDRYNPGYVSLWSLTKALAMNVEGSQLKYSTISAASLDVEDFMGDVLLVAQNLATGAQTELKVLNSYTLFSPAVYGEIKKYQSDLVSVDGLADGEYRIFVGSKSSNEASIQPMRSHETVNNSYILTKSGSTLSLTAENNPNWTATTGISGVEVGDNTGDGIVRVYDMSGRMVYSAPAAGFSVADVPAEGVLIIKNGSQVKKVIK